MILYSFIVCKPVDEQLYTTCRWSAQKPVMEKPLLVRKHRTGGAAPLSPEGFLCAPEIIMSASTHDGRCALARPDKDGLADT